MPQLHGKNLIVVAGLNGSKAEDIIHYLLDSVADQIKAVKASGQDQISFYRLMNFSKHFCRRGTSSIGNKAEFWGTSIGAQNRKYSETLAIRCRKDTCKLLATTTDYVRINKQCEDIDGSIDKEYIETIKDQLPRYTLIHIREFKPHDLVKLHNMYSKSFDDVQIITINRDLLNIMAERFRNQTCYRRMFYEQKKVFAEQDDVVDDDLIQYLKDLVRSFNWTATTYKRWVKYKTFTKEGIMPISYGKFCVDPEYRKNALKKIGLAENDRPSTFCNVRYKSNKHFVNAWVGYVQNIEEFRREIQTTNNQRYVQAHMLEAQKRPYDRYIAAGKPSKPKKPEKKDKKAKPRKSSKGVIERRIASLEKNIEKSTLTLTALKEGVTKLEDEAAKLTKKHADLVEKAKNKYKKDIDDCKKKLEETKAKCEPEIQRLKQKIKKLTGKGGRDLTNDQEMTISDDRQRIKKIQKRIKDAAKNLQKASDSKLVSREIEKMERAQEKIKNTIPVKIKAKHVKINAHSTKVAEFETRLKAAREALEEAEKKTDKSVQKNKGQKNNDQAIKASDQMIK